THRADARGRVHPADGRGARRDGSGGAGEDADRGPRPPARGEGAMTRFSPRRWWGIVRKEFIQLQRDRLTFGMIVGIPVMQLLLFGFAINTDPRNLPTAVLSLDQSVWSRSI